MAIIFTPKVRDMFITTLFNTGHYSWDSLNSMSDSSLLGCSLQERASKKSTQEQMSEVAEARAHLVALYGDAFADMPDEEIEDLDPNK